jgi:hypothetical protein
VAGTERLRLGTKILGVACGENPDTDIIDLVPHLHSGRLYFGSAEADPRVSLGTARRRCSDTGLLGWGPYISARIAANALFWLGPNLEIVAKPLAKPMIA